MIDDFQEVRLRNPVHCLGQLVVIHQDQLLSVHGQEVPAGDHAHIVSVHIQDGKIPESVLRHDLTGGFRRLLQMEGDQVL